MEFNRNHYFLAGLVVLILGHSGARGRFVRPVERKHPLPGDALSRIRQEPLVDRCRRQLFRAEKNAPSARMVGMGLDFGAGRCWCCTASRCRGRPDDGRAVAA